MPAELARLNRDMAPMASRIMAGRASVAEQQDYARRPIAAGERLHCRVDGMVVEETMAGHQPIELPGPVTELDWQP